MTDRDWKETVMKNKDELVEKICLDCCDGFEGRCQRYPKLSRSCLTFLPLERAFKAGEQEGMSRVRDELEDIFRIAKTEREVWVRVRKLTSNLWKPTKSLVQG